MNGIHSSRGSLITDREALAAGGGGVSVLKVTLLTLPGAQAHPTLLSILCLPPSSPSPPSGPVSVCSWAHHSVPQFLICEMV